MKKFKTTAVLLAFALALSLQGMIASPVNALAAENLTSDDSVQYATIASVNAFRDYIDNNGAYASQDIITEENASTDVHKIIIDKPGKLLIAPLEINGEIDTYLYTDFALTEQVGDAIVALSSSQAYIVSVDVTAGTYYYRGCRWNGWDPLTLTTYIGFIPADGKITDDNLYSATADPADSDVTIPEIDKPESLLDYISNSKEPVTIDTIGPENFAVSTTYRFTVSEDGWFFAYPLCEEESVNWNLYSNKDLTSYVATSLTKPDLEGTLVSAYLKAGTYYYNGVRWNGNDPLNIYAYLGFMPASSRISVYETSFNEDMTSATVTFNYDKNYLKNVSSGTIRLVKGHISPNDLYNEDIWKTDNRANALENNTAKITENGEYTVRIASPTDPYYCLAYFTITELEEPAPAIEKPANPKITTAKKGTKLVKGTATAGLKITVKINKKTYTTISGTNGKWSVKLNKKLKKGNKIKAFASNSNAVKSATATYKVK